MITTGTTKDTVKLTENAIGILYLLRFIYPNKLPLKISPDPLSFCLVLAQKYDVGGALEMIDALILLDTPPHKLLSSDPIRAHQLAAQLNLPQTRASAARFITADRVDFCDLDKVSDHSQKYSSRRLIYLMNIQAMRAKALSDVLFRFDKAPLLAPYPSPNVFYDLSCRECQLFTNKQVGYRNVPPSWVIGWAQLAYETLLISSGPLAKLDRLFKSTSLEIFAGRGDVCQTCLSDYGRISEKELVFARWAEGIKETLDTQLAKLELIYAL